MTVELKLKRWGNSMGVVIPREIVEARNLQENDEIQVTIVKKADLSDIFGLVKERKMSGQAFKDMVRKGWTSSSQKER